ncbi:hypothetical protein ACFL35_04040 [Candidatus Riflebacteria bacterium]
MQNKKDSNSLKALGFLVLIFFFFVLFLPILGFVFLIILGPDAETSSTVRFLLWPIELAKWLNIW